MITSIVIFFIGVCILLISSQMFVHAAERISLSLKVSPLVIGTTIVAVGTSLPELAVSVISSIKGDVGLALGNVIGSNIVNITLILPIGILIGNLRIGTTKTQRTVLVMGIVTVIFVLLYFMNAGRVLSGIMLLIATCIITVSEYVWGIQGRNKEDRKRYKNIKLKPFTAIDMGRFILSVGGIVGGGIMTVFSIEKIASITGYSTTVLGLTVTAIATSLPELMTTIFSEEDHEEKIAIGNIIGSNMYNLMLIGGLSILVSSWGTIRYNEFFMLLVSTAAFIGITLYFKGKVIAKPVSIALFFLFFWYIISLRNM